MYYDDGNIKATESALNSADVKLHQAPAGEHDKHAERAYLTVKSTMRSSRRNENTKTTLWTTRIIL